MTSVPIRGISGLFTLTPPDGEWVRVAHDHFGEDSDLSLYNEDKIAEGVQNDNLFELLDDEIKEGRDLYESRVAPGLFGRNFYDRAIVDILVRSKGHVESVMW